MNDPFEVTSRSDCDVTGIVKLNGMLRGDKHEEVQCLSKIKQRRRLSRVADFAFVNLALKSAIA